MPTSDTRRMFKECDITAVVTVMQGSAMNSNNVLGGSYFALFATGTNARHIRPLDERK